MRFSIAFTFCSIFFVFLNAQASGVFLFGGGPRPQSALKKLVQTSSQSILVVTWATQDPVEVFEAISSDLEIAGAKDVVHAPHEMVSAKDLRDLKILMSKSDVIFFSGGDQDRALDVIERLGVRSLFIKFFDQGGTLAGTSAGTALMPEVAIRGGNATDLPNVRKGLSVIHFLVDQHFIVRGREPRLKKLIEKERTSGIGVDEGMCAHVEGDFLTAFGPTEVQIFEFSAKGSIQKTRVLDGQTVRLPIVK